MANEKTRRRVISIRWIVTGAAVFLMATTVLGVGGFAERNARQALIRELETRLLLEARNLALASSGALLSDFPELTLTPILSEIREDQPELAFAVVLDLEGSVRGHADARMIGQRFQLPSDLVAMDAGDRFARGEQIRQSPELLVSATAVRHPGGDRIGTAYVALYRTYIDGVMAAARQKQAILLAILLVVGIVAAALFMSVLLKPVGALRAGLERIGRGDLDTPVQLNDRTELGLLAETMNEMSTRIKEAQEERVEKERLTREVELAREIQSSLLPAGKLEVAGCTIDGAQKAAAEVGGDYYDVFELADGKIGVAIADVSGKGLGGCLVTSMLSVLLRAFRDVELSPTGLLVKLDDRLKDSLRPGTFITMFYGIYDPQRRSFTFSSAGHSPLLVHRANGKSEWYKTRGIPLGAVRGGAIARTLKDERIDLAPGDVVVQYTDGINEAFDITGEEQFGFDRLEQVTARHAADGCGVVIDAIRSAVAEWAGDQPPLDDETLVVLGLDARAPAPSAGPDPRPDVASDPAAALERARGAGHGLRLPADLDRLTGIRAWIQDLPRLGDLDAREGTVLESALYEVCANIAEHGYEKNVGKSFELWWMPEEADGPKGKKTPGCRGLFVVVDHGKAFRPPDLTPADFEDPAIRRRRRGIGLEIIHRAMSRVSYHPGTPAGNVTLLGFDPAKTRVEEEVPHG